jgi:hypothetical protein
MLKRKVGHDDEEPVFSASKKILKQDICQAIISDSSKRKLRREEYTVGWICPLEVEQTAALEMLDDEHKRLFQRPTDYNVYSWLPHESPNYMNRHRSRATPIRNFSLKIFTSYKYDKFR